MALPDRRQRTHGILTGVLYQHQYHGGHHEDRTVLPVDIRHFNGQMNLWCHHHWAIK